MTVVSTGASTRSTATPTASVRAVALLASARTAASTLAGSSVLIAATTWTLAAVTESEMPEAGTPSEAARPALKPSWSRLSTVPATVTVSSTMGWKLAPGGSGGSGGGGGGTDLPTIRF